jgi:prevent-host-death family protein
MKVIPLSEAKANLSRYAKTCRDEPVVVTINGKPAFEIVPIDERDDLIDQLLEHNPQFRQTLQRRLKEPRLSAEEALRRFDAAPKPAKRRRTTS